MRKQVLECTLCHRENDLSNVNLFGGKDILDKIDIRDFMPLPKHPSNWEPESWKDDWLEITRGDGFVAHICPWCKGYFRTAVSYGLLKVSID